MLLASTLSIFGACGSLPQGPADGGDSPRMVGESAPDGSTSPGSTSPGSTSPGSTSPGSTSPGSTSPGSTSPGSTSPGSTSPGSTSPGPATPSTGSPGWLHTDHATIVDDSGHPVRLTGLSWFGLETANYALHGLWSRSMASMLDQIQSLGYNTLRVPFSSQLFDAGSTPVGIDFSQNPDLQGKSGLEVLDALIAGARQRHLRVILDRHRPDSGAQSALWYTAQYPESRWIDDWKMLATRYQSDPTVIGFDLHNEPHDPATWGDDKAATDWRLAAERAGNAILAVNPHLLIIVEGIQTVGTSTYWWGGNLKNAGTYPVRLSVSNQLVYSAHDYPSSVFNQTWFSAPDYPANLSAVWDAYWGYLVEQNIAPVWVGEFGTRDESASDQQWFTGITGYLATHQLSFAFWCWNPDSGDTGGILADDWKTVNASKQSVLQPLLAPPIQ
jgi:endoglucanase